MTTVEILFRYVAPPTEAVMFALSAARDVYGIRRLKFEAAARTVLVEYDATRLSGAVVASLLRRAGLEIVEELPLLPPVPPQAPAETAKA